jgi:hypothetical protein
VIILLILVGLLMAYGALVLFTFAMPVSKKTLEKQAAHQAAWKQAQIEKDAARQLAVEAEVERLRAAERAQGE